MKNSRLLALLETFEKKDFREMQKFVRSPFFNQRKDVIGLFDYIGECLTLHKVIPTKEQLFKKIYPKQKLDLQQVRLLMSILHKLIEKYFAHQAFFEKEIQVKTQLARVFRQRKLSKHFQRTIQEAQRFQENQAFRNADYYNANYLIQLEHYHFTSREQRIAEQNLQEISDNIDLAYLAIKLRQICFSLSHQAVYKKEYHFGLLEEILKYIEKEDLQKIPAIAVYFYCYKALSQAGKVEFFQAFKSLIFQHQALFPASEIRDLFLLAINYCIRQLNEGKTAFAKEGFEIYKKGLQNNILITNGILSRFTYRNIVAMGLQIGDYEWVEKFLHGYKNNLDKKHRASTFSFNLAKLEYERKNFHVALQLLQKASYNDLLLNLAAKTLSLKIYYELDEWNLLESHLESMKTFIHRKKVIGYHQKNYLNIISFTKKLVHLNFYDKQEISALRKQIENEEILTERVWLLANVGRV